MRILHYALGFPPLRRGGLVKYSLDVAYQQKLDGNNVFILVPGSSSLLTKTKITQGADYKGIDCFKIQNPSLIPIYAGIRNPNDILTPRKKISEKEITRFLAKLNPDIFHIHTAMGLPVEFLQIARNLNIKIIYSSHDYYGICPKLNLMNLRGENCRDNSGPNCAECCFHSPSFFKTMYLYNSDIIPVLKKHFTPVVELLKKYRQKKGSPKPTGKVEINSDKAGLFNQLTLHYKNFFSLVSCFHFNSYVTKEQFEHFLPKTNGIVIPITHSGVQDNRKIRNATSPVCLGFIGSTKLRNGFPLLYETLTQLESEGTDKWTVVVCQWKDDDFIHDKVIFRGSFAYNEIGNVFEEFDVLIVPRNETFSFIVLEAISYGIPVCVSDTVGAKMIVSLYNPDFIFKTPTELKILLQNILQNPQILNDFNKEILGRKFSFSLNEHVNSIYKNLYK